MVAGRFRDQKRWVASLGRVLTPSAASAAAADLMTREDARSAPSEPARRASELERPEHLRGIVHEHFSSVWRFLRRLGFEEHVVDDAAQDLFFVALRRIDEVTPGRERAFLFGAALRIATKMKRKGAREVPVDPQGVRGERAATTATPETLLDDERARELLYRLLSELEERLRVVFVMYEVEGMTMQEIADALEIPMGTVASRLRLARDDFRARLERYRARTRREVGT
jgi:RNA polymerase sigma-70 factor, ECF subfamily